MKLFLKKMGTSKPLTTMLPDVHYEHKPTSPQARKPTSPQAPSSLMLKVKKSLKVLKHETGKLYFFVVLVSKTSTRVSVFDETYIYGLSVVMIVTFCCVREKKRELEKKEI